MKRYSKRQGVVRRILDIMGALAEAPKSCAEIAVETDLQIRTVRYYMADLMVVMPNRIKRYRRKSRLGGRGGTGPYVYWLE